MFVNFLLEFVKIVFSRLVSAREIRLKEIEFHCLLTN